MEGKYPFSYIYKGDVTFNAYSMNSQGEIDENWALIRPDLTFK